MSYRDTLYTDYSKHFGTGKKYSPSVMFKAFEIRYPASFPDKGSVIVDVGCGKGEWLLWMKERGCQNLTGLDVAASELHYLKDQGIDLIEGNVVKDLGQQAAQFDLVHAKDVLEHLTKDEAVAFLKGAYEALKPGGELWILTFNAQSPMSTSTRYGDFTHELGVTPNSLAQVQRAVGFEVVSVRGQHVCGRSMGGRLRRAIFRVVNAVCSLVLKSRHGKGHWSEGNIESHTALPDLFSVVRKPTRSE